MRCARARAVASTVTNWKPPILPIILADPSRFEQFIQVMKWVQSEIVRAKLDPP